MITMRPARRVPALSCACLALFTAQHETGRENHETQHTIQGGTARRLGAFLIMPKGPNGERRPADVVGCAVTVARIATGDIEDTKLKHPAKRAAGLKGANARVKALLSEKRRQIARAAAKTRWDAVDGIDQ